MSDLPVIFSAPMIRALLDGSKTMTRRLAWRGARKNECRPHENPKTMSAESAWTRVKPGDQLWVKENFYLTDDGDHECAVYAANELDVARHINQIGQIAASHGLGLDWQKRHLKLRPSIHLPRWASRLTLIVTATKIERLQDISEADAIAEGVQHRWLKAANSAPRSHYFIDAGDRIEHSGYSAKAAFEMLWLYLHGPASWDANPEVVALTFTVHKQNIDAMPRSEAA